MSLYKGTTLISGHQLLYSSTGQNTDGAMTQKATSDALNAKLNNNQITNCVLEAPNGVYSVSNKIITLKTGLKVLIPDGRNADGTLKNIEYTLTEDSSEDLSTATVDVLRTCFLFAGSSTLHASSFANGNIFYYQKASLLPATVGSTKYCLAYCEAENYWYYTNGSTTASWTQTSAVPILGFLTTSSTLTIQKEPKTVHLCDTNMVDGQWVNESSTLANGITAPTTTNLSYDLSTYLPNNGYDYEVIFSGRVITGTTSGNTVRLSIATDIITSVAYVCGARTRTASSMDNVGSVVLPVGVGRKVNVLYDSGYAGTFYLYACGYRRIGRNS